MNRAYLYDMSFLQALDEMRIKEHYIKIQVMNYKEEPIRQIQGIATAGNITVNGSSAVRRTISLTVAVSGDENNIANIENVISANKKIKIEIGLKNPLMNYQHYGDMIWFPAGVFIVSEANASTTANSATISIKGKDKMCMLDGTCGGTLPATVTFHETYIEDSFGQVSVKKIPIFTIIKELVHHYGKELEQNIIINDVDLVSRMSTKYVGAYPIWFTDDYSSFIISENAPSNKDFLSHKFVYGQDIGYMETDFTFPGELVFEAGEPATAVLDKIIQTIGNYEYFYDLEGHFVFQEKKNYLNNYYTPIIDLTDEFYVKAFSDTKYYKTLENAKDSISYMNAPKYDNIKNDFVVWGLRTDATGVTRNLQYHVAIDEKPIENELALQFMWDVSNYKNGKKEHLYYLFKPESDFENPDDYKDFYKNVPEPKPVELKCEKGVLETQINNEIEKFLYENYILQEYYESSFIIYVRVYWEKDIRYYKVTVENDIIKDCEYLYLYTEQISDQKILIGYCPNPNKSVTSEDEGDNILDWTDEINPDMDTENKYDEENKNASSKNNINNKKDDKDKENSSGEENTEEEEEKEEEKIEKYYILLEQKDKELGYYNDKKEWVNVYSLKQEKISIADLKSIYNSFKTNHNIRIFVSSEFEDSYDNLSCITSINNSSGLYLSEANPRDIRIFNNGELKKIDTIFPYSFEGLDIKDEEGKEIFSATDKENMIIGLLPYYLENESAVLSDIGVIIDLANGGEEYKNLLPWTDTIDPDMDTDNKYDEENKDEESSNPLDKEEQNKEEEEKSEKAQLEIISDVIAKLIYTYYLNYNATDFVSELLTELFNYYYSFKVKMDNFDDKYIYEIITFYPELKEDFDYEDNFYYTLIGKPCNEWREELYRQALLNQENANEAGYYDAELLAYWRSNFDTLNEEWEKEWNEQIGSPWNGWNPGIYIDPGLLVYWLDFIDSYPLITNYSVNQIGRRTKAISKDNIKLLYKLEVPDVIFIENTGTSDVAKKIEEYKILGQQYCAIKPTQMKYFSSSGTGTTAFDLIREMLYSNLYYNISVTINCVPKYYLEPNNIIYISDDKSNIYGDFVITQFTIPLGYNGNMSITTNQAIVRV